MGVVSRITTQLQARAAAASHRWPARRLNIIFVSGQDGGQLTAVTLGHILTRHGHHVGLITADFIDINGERAKGSDQADVLGEPYRLHALLAQMRRAKCDYVIIDVPQQLPAHQFAGITPLMAVQRRCGDSHFTEAANTARQAAWRRILALRPQFAVFNRDDPSYDKPAGREELTISYGTNPKAECQITEVEIHPKGSAATLIIDHQTELHLASVLTGKTAIYSLVAAAAAAYLLHVPIGVIEDGIRAVPHQPTALAFLPAQRPYQIVRDGAATPDGIAETLEALKHFARNRLVAVLGANLAQPAPWRPTIGETALQYADRLIVTDGEYSPGESAQTVRQQILQASVGAEARTDEIVGRREALEKALAIARRNDIIAVLASTVRPYRQLGSERQQWDDAKQIDEILEG